MDNHIDDAAIERTVNRICEERGNAIRQRALEGARCAASYWREEDGDEAEFSSFCLEHLARDEDGLELLYSRLEAAWERLDGAMHSLHLGFEWGVHVDKDPLLPVDGILSAWSPYAHLSDDFYANKLAFVIHLNFPYRSLERKLKEGPSWRRREWAMTRLGDAFTERVPSDASQRLATAMSAASNYIMSYNIHAAMLRDGDSGPLFPEDKRLLMHWNMRDEIKALYADVAPDGAALRKQRLAYAAMERVVDGGIPLAFIDSRDLAWDPKTGETFAADGSRVQTPPEADGRYEKLLAIFQAERGVDLWCPDNPTLMARRFNAGREMPEREVERIFHELLSAPAFARAAKLVSSRLGRPLEAFDVWFRDFGSGRKPNEAELDRICRSRYPDARAFKADIPRILRALGFDDGTADWLAERIEVDQARGSGHAMGPGSRSDSARLRTRVPAGGMDYKGFNIACHELGHNVEQVFSMHGMDEYLLNGVPNTAFTEAFAFVFQARDLFILGRSETAAPADAGAGTLSDYWATCEISGVALVDMEIWRWMYAHPSCNARELRQAALDISRSVWNRYFAPAFGLRDATVLGVYSHMIEYALYLPDYPLGHVIAFQIEAAMAGRSVGSEMGRMCRLGRLTPGQWMRQAVGADVSPEPMIKAAGAALSALGF